MTAPSTLDNPTDIDNDDYVHTVCWDCADNGVIPLLAICGKDVTFDQEVGDGTDCPLCLLALQLRWTCPVCHCRLHT